MTQIAGSSAPSGNLQMTTNSVAQLISLKVSRYHEWTESSPVEKDLEVVWDERWDLTQQHMVVAQKANRTLGCIKMSRSSTLLS